MMRFQKSSIKTINHLDHKWPALEKFCYPLFTNVSKQNNQRCFLFVFAKKKQKKNHLKPKKQLWNISQQLYNQPLHKHLPVTCPAHFFCCKPWPWLSFSFFCLITMSQALGEVEFWAQGKNCRLLSSCVYSFLARLSGLAVWLQSSLSGASLS